MGGGLDSLGCNCNVCAAVWLLLRIGSLVNARGYRIFQNHRHLLPPFQSISPPGSAIDVVVVVVVRTFAIAVCSAVDRLIDWPRTSDVAIGGLVKFPREKYAEVRFFAAASTIVHLCLFGVPATNHNKGEDLREEK